MSDPLRILMVSNVPWRRELGAARGQIDVAEAFRQRGHVVEKFDYKDAFGDSPVRRWHRLVPLRFARRVRRHIREHGDEFDVIEGLPEDVPFSKRDLRFDGLLVARSMGLHPLYGEYIRFERAAWPNRIPGTFVGKALQRISVRRGSAICRRALRAADLVRVLNTDEEAYIHDALGLGHKCVRIPDGLSPGFAEALARATLPGGARLRRREVVFVGAWSLRKGAADWPEIIRGTRSVVPDARFRFLGTGRDRADILSDLGLDNGAAKAISIVPHFAAEDLPELLGAATVGALPSYIEGCPLSVLEQLASGLPTIAYDAPGSRDILRRLPKSLLAPRGDTRRFAALLAEILTLAERSYLELAAECISVAGEFRSTHTADASLDAYAAAHQRDALDLNRSHPAHTVPVARETR